MSTNYLSEAAPERVNINKMVVHRETKIGDRLLRNGVYYLVVSEGGKNLGEHWVCQKDDDQAHRRAGS